VAHSIYYRPMTRDRVRRDELVSVTTWVDTLAVPAGQRLYVEGMVGPTVTEDGLAYVEKLPDGHTLITFEKDALVSAENLHSNLMTCMHLRYARVNRSRTERNRTRRERLFHHTVKLWPKLEAGLWQAGFKPIYVPGGLQYAIAFCGDDGEMIIGAPFKTVEYSHEGEIPAGFIVSRHIISPILAGLRPREEYVEQRSAQPAVDSHRYPEYSR
jgi:hypothetical protein